MSAAKLRAFLAVARQGSFSAGAESLGLTQATLSTQILGLEKEYNLELFHRRGRRVELTDVGLQLLPIAQQLSALEVEAHNLLYDSGKLNRGQLKIGAVGPFHVIEMVEAYRLQYPQIDIAIKVGNSAEVFANLKNYTTDIAVLARFHDLPDCFAFKYARHAIILFAANDHPFAFRGQVRIDELHGQFLLQREIGSSTRLALENAMQKAGVVCRQAMEIGSREALREAVARGLGLGAVSEAEFIPDPRFKPVRIVGDPAYTETYVYCLAERRNSLLPASFINVVLKLAEHRQSDITT